MTTPQEDPSREQEPAAAPTVTVAPAEGARRRQGFWAAVPHHLGRARTSTVVLSVLFLAIGLLYLYVRPDPEAARSSLQVPEQSTPAPATTEAPGSTEDAPATTAPETTAEPTTSGQTTTSAAPTARSPESAGPTSEEPPPSAPRASPGPLQTSPGDPTGP